MAANPIIRFCDKFLPNQPQQSYLFGGDDYAPALYDAICRASGIVGPDQELKLDKTDMFSVEEMASNPVSLRFMQFLIKVSGAKRVLEIGSFIGVSAMYFAKAVNPGGEVVTIEKFDHFAAIARRNFALNELSDCITLLEGDAIEVIMQLPQDKKFDLIFIDGNKERYKDYLVLTEPLLSSKGIVVVDDCFFNGDAVNNIPTSEKGAGTRAFMDYVATRTDLTRVALPICNGIMLLVRN